ncbi:glycoside hydrolase N-terminal domain-containing protein [Alkalibacterium iburiense]|uniref:Glycoside hydrolase N-terminal domain-containing protein n=1 Tax=Alkalibacterium iburiense TaxID=290589 RepID=A0ABP3GUG9_9LACT
MFEIPKKGIWSTSDSKKWQDGYFVGNGEIGGTLYGNSEVFSLIANHHELFLKSNRMDSIPDLSNYLNELRQTIEEEGYQAGIDFFEKVALERGYSGLTMSDVYHPAAQIDLTLLTEIGNDLAYKRAIDYEKGLVYTQAKSLTHKIETSFFATKDKKALYFDLKTSEPIDITIQFKDFNHSELNQKMTQTNFDSLEQTASYYDHTGYRVPLKWVSDSKESTITEKGVTFTQVTELRLAFSIYFEEEELTLDRFDEIRTQHIQAHQRTYDGTSINLVSDDERQRSYESLIQELEEAKTIPLVLYEKLYDASRYFIQAMSGKALPNLQGIWSGDFNPPWSGDYTLDTNVELAITSLAGLGQFEGFEGFFNKMRAYDEDFKENAKKYFDARGYLVPVHASTRALHVHWNKEWPLIFWTAGAGWLAHFYHEYYTHTLDKEFLRTTAIPFYEQTLLFYEDFIIEDEEGKALLRPSYSAENGMADNSTMDIAVIKATIQYLKHAYAVLNKVFPEEYDSLYNRLPAYMIDEEGVLKEWIDETKEENHNHRHFSNLYPVFQSKEITKENRDLWEAANKAFDKRLEAWLLSEEGDTSSSHGRIHAAMCAIALERANDVEASLNELIRNRAFYPSLATSHYNHSHVFNLDANGSYPKVLHDALIYPEGDGSITLFKALPEWLHEGELKGIHLPNGIQVKRFKWSQTNQTGELSVLASLPTTLFIRLKEQQIEVRLKEKETQTVSLSWTDPGDE